MQHIQGTYRYRAYPSTAQTKSLARRQSTRAKYKTHTKSKQARQTTIPTPELNLQKSVPQRKTKTKKPKHNNKQNARNKRFTDNGNSQETNNKTKTLNRKKRKAYNSRPSPG